MSDSISLNQLFDEYIELISPLQSDHTIATKIGYYRKHIKEGIGFSGIENLTYKEYQKFLNDLLKSGLKPKTVKNIKDMLQVIYKFAKKLKYVSENPLLDVELPKFDNSRYFSFSVDEQKHVIKSIMSYVELPYSDMFFFLLHGRRANEVISMTWEFIDLKNRLYFIPAKINKARRNMEYKMSDMLFARLSYYHAKACLEQKTIHPKGYVFINFQTGTKYSDLKRPWKRFLKWANIPYMRLHDIRHLIGTYSINVLELPIEKVSQTLGHVSIEVTQKYVSPRPDVSKYVIDTVMKSVDLSSLNT